MASCPTPRPVPSRPDTAKAVGDFKGGTVEYRTDRYGNVHVAIGKASFEPSTVSSRTSPPSLDEINRVRPASTKGRYIKKLTLSSTMGPGVKVDPGRLDELASAGSA